MSMDEQRARRVVLAQAIETADAHGKILSVVEREQVDLRALATAKAQGVVDEGVAVERFLQQRAELVLEVTRNRNPALASLQEARPWHRWLALGTPVAAFLLGVVTDRIANPHQVDLLSLPLLAIVAWNLGVYAFLIAGYALPRSKPERLAFAVLGGWVTGWRGWRGRSGHLRAEVTALFFLRWHAVTAALNAQRWKKVLHFAAAAWGAGVAVSLLARGLVVEYRVGWESTFLSAEQVHSILSILFMPMVALFSFAPLSVQEVARLQFGTGTGAVAGARWVAMYATLLLLVVVLPRLLLAVMAFWREKALSREVAIDLRDPYYQRLIARLRPTRVQLCLVAHRSQDTVALMRVLMQDPDALRQEASEALHPAVYTLITSPNGDEIRIALMPGIEAIAHLMAKPDSLEPGLARRALSAVWRRSAEQRPSPGEPALRAVRDDSDVVLHVVASDADVQAARPLLQWLGKPVLVLLNQPHPEPGEGAGAGSLAFDAFARCWVQERILLDAVGRCLPDSKTQGYARLTTAWDDRNRARFRSAMSVLASHLFYAARQKEDVHSAPLSMKTLVSAADREGHERARKAAMAAVVERLARSQAQSFSQLLRLHGVDDTAGGVPEHRLEEKFVVQQAINTPQAGMAGAATGAAMGASVDLLTGGLTLGAAAALGALVGGGAALVASAWKNKTTTSGVTVVQLSDEMMQAMLEAGLLRYLAAAHFGRPNAGSHGGEIRPVWKSGVVAAVEAHRDRLLPLWAAARAQKDEMQTTAALAGEVEAIARKLMKNLYPSAPNA